MISVLEALPVILMAAAIVMIPLAAAQPPGPIDGKSNGQGIDRGR